ncbi:MAG: PmoA family protein [Planctomycetaceae bacterium]|nr:PmoA family protein [Planctomycetaceae bacterium]
MSNILFVSILFADESVLPELSLRKSSGGDYEVFVDGKFFARYMIDFEGTPIIYPIHGVNNKPMTRSFPMETSKDKESVDHPHHRSFWFTHGEVNDTNFWLSDKDTKNLGKIVHQKFTKAESNKNNVILVTENNWMAANGRNVICKDVRTFCFGAFENGDRFIDFDIVVTANADKVTFYDTKEGTFGIRVASAMEVDAARQIAKNTKKEPTSYIVNAEGITNDQAWAKRSAWVDYVGQIDNQTVGIAILNHPSSFRYPTYWHVRTYGLFAANPFGERGFGIRKKNSQDSGNFEMKKNDNFTLKYRIILHKGDTKQAKIKDRFLKYSRL